MLMLQGFQCSIFAVAGALFRTGYTNVGEMDAYGSLFFRESILLCFPSDDADTDNITHVAASQLAMLEIVVRISAHHSKTTVNCEVSALGAHH